MIDIEKIILEKAKEKKRTVVVCEGWDDRIITAVNEITKEKIANIVLLGDEKAIKENAKKLNIELRGIKIENPKTSKLRKVFADNFAEQRKSKGMTPEKAYELMEDVNYFGVMYAKEGHADAVSGSCICPTADLMRAAFQVLGTKEGYLVASEISVLEDVEKDRVYFFTDSSLNIDPTPEQLAQIALNGAEMAKGLGLVPKVALLSFSTKGSGGDHPAILKIREALEIAKKREPKLIIDGEMQVDAAVNPDAARRKCPNSILKGDANVLVFPNLTAGNILLHSLIQFGKLKYDAVMLVGIKKPVTIQGRSSTAEIIKNIIITAAAEANM